MVVRPELPNQEESKFVSVLKLNIVSDVARNFRQTSTDNIMKLAVF